MKVIYLAGLYRAATEYEILSNIEKAGMAAAMLWRMGYAVICPHKNAAFFGGVATDDHFIEAGIELMKRSDAVMLLAGWRGSTGALKEKAAAEEAGIPVFELVDDLTRTFPPK